MLKDTAEMGVLENPRAGTGREIGRLRGRALLQRCIRVGRCL